MSYFLTNIEDVNNLFRKDDFLNYSFEFTKTEEVINNAIKYFSIEYFNDEEFEKVPLNPLEYNYKLKNHYLKWDINYLNKHLVISDFEDDLKQGIHKEQEHYLEKLEEKLLNLYTQLQIKNELNKFLMQTKKSIEALNNLKGNKYQKITINLFLESYKKVLFYLNNKYENYLPKPIKDELLSKFIIHTKIDNFLTIETELINKGFINKSANKLYWIEKKVKLVNLCRLLLDKGYFNKFFSIERVIDYFEKRYNIDTGDQAKPSKFNKSIKLIEADFLFFRL